MIERRELDLTSVKFAMSDVRLIASRRLKGRLDIGRRGHITAKCDVAAPAPLRIGNVRLIEGPDKPLKS